MIKEVTVKGKIFSGNKNVKQYVNLPWVRRQIEEKIGFNPYPGTLNLRLQNETSVYELRKLNGITIKLEKGYCKGKCFKASVMGKVDGAVIFPNVPMYPSDLLEIIAPNNLRKTLRLKDGTEIEVTIRIE